MNKGMKKISDLNWKRVLAVVAFAIAYPFLLSAGYVLVPALREFLNFLSSKTFFVLYALIIFSPVVISFFALPIKTAKWPIVMGLGIIYIVVAFPMALMISMAFCITHTNCAMP